jgi:uncharacterized protein (TIGR01244 family)
MMDIRPLTPTYAVSPQIDSEDLAAIKAAGYTTIIDNRPDPEIPPSHQSLTMRQSAEALGLKFFAVPVAGREMSVETVAAHKAALDAAGGPVLAYCASGTRSAIAWALSQASATDADAILTSAERAGYQLEHLRPTLEALAAQKR